jgi:hypothetical protein
VEAYVMLEIAMDSPTGVNAPPNEKDWLALGQLIEQAFGLLSRDPLMALAQLAEAEAQVNTLLDQMTAHALRGAKPPDDADDYEKKSKWAEIEAVIGLRHDPTARQRITYAGRLVSAGSPLMALQQLHEVERHSLDRVMEHAVREARQSGKSWAEIAVATDVTRQAAWRRWFDRGIR